VSRYDYDLFVIGAGSGGVRAARLSAERGARVAIAEEDRVGGTCVIRGCVPKKLFVTGAHFAETFEDAVGFGWTVEGLRFDWATLAENVARDVEWLSAIYIRNLEKAGAELLRTRAILEDAHTIRLVDEDRTVTAETILVSTGGKPQRDLEIPGIEHAITSNEFFHLERLPHRVLIVGGGYIAVELAGIFAALGTETTIVYRGDKVLRGFDDDIRKTVMSGLERSGIDVVCSDSLVSIEEAAGGFVGTTAHGKRIPADHVLLAIGRVPNTRGLCLEEVGVKLDAEGAVVVDAYSRTNVDNIFAVGDVTNRVLLTPVAIREGAAFVETAFGGQPKAVDYECIPTAVFSSPEVGTVGLSEEEARARFPSLDIYRSTFKPLPNRVAGRDQRMLVKLVVDGDTDRVLGCHFVGPHASELAQLVAIAVKMGATKADFDATTAVHPTIAEEIVTLSQPAERIRREAAE
jgi:glutathione reductase (NADPH)